MRVLVEAYGCTLNRGESEELIDSLLDMGQEIVSDMDSADAFVLFTCGVIETTERRMLKRIREFARSPEKPLMVCGCLPNINPQKIMKAAPHAILFGPAEHEKALAHLAHSEKHQFRQVRNTSVGILPIATGCHGSCSYCATKNARGGLRSKAPELLSNRLAKLLAGGAAEIQLCAQDTAIYGRDIGVDLDTLVKTLERTEGDFMMRIGMMNPAGVRESLDMVLRAYESPKVFKFLHLPVQSGSDAVLERMRRRHTVRDFIEIVEAFRAKFPGLALSTDIIIGFPGETEEDFEKSMDLMKLVKPDIINVTRYSARPGTEAKVMKPQIPGWTAKERSRALSSLRFDLTGMNYGDMRGRYVRALATERRKSGTTFLRTGEYRPVVVEGEHELGKWHDLRITGKKRTHLTGKLESVK